MSITISTIYFDVATNPELLAHAKCSNAEDKHVAPREISSELNSVIISVNENVKALIGRLRYKLLSMIGRWEIISRIELQNEK